MLRVVKNVSWKQRIRNEVLYGKIPKVTTTIAAQRVTFSRHCWRSKDELAHQLLLWEPTHGKRARGIPRRTFIDQLVDDTELQKKDLANAMNDSKREIGKAKLWMSDCGRYDDDVTSCIITLKCLSHTLVALFLPLNISAIPC